ncbi:MAG: amidohydrolase family protein [Proteobacteria bacterium]|nr:amidohydrolase family protein [Pseudomonadota bacterium]
MIDVLISARVVIAMEPACRTLDDGAIAVDRGRIVAVGPREKLEAEFPDVRRRLGGPHCVAMPGFVDGHSHAGHGLVRNLGADDFPAWRQACRDIYMGGAPTEFWQAEAQLSSIERLKAGVTTAVAYLGGGDENNRSDGSEIATAYAEAYGTAGGRLILGVGPTRPPFPKRYARFDGTRRSTLDVTFVDQLATCRQILRELPSGRVGVALTTPTVNPEIHRGPHFAELCGMARSMKALAREFDAVLMMDGQRGGTVAFAAGELGIVDRRTLLSHALDLTADEIRIVARTGATVANNPLSGSAVWGRCPVPELLDAGARVIVSSDGLAPDCGADMFRVMRACAHYHRAMARDPHLLPPGRVLRMATSDPADFFGIGDAVGTLAPGKRADIVLVDLDKPHLAPATMPLYQLAYGATGQDVDTVLVDGEIVLENRRLAKVDEAAILARARIEAERMLERTGLTHLLATPDSFWDDRYDRPRYAGPHQKTVSAEAFSPTP